MRTLIITALTGLLLPAIAVAQPTAPAAGQIQVADASVPAASPALPDPTTYVPRDTEYEEVRDSVNAPMLTSGALVFGASYGASVIIAGTDNSRGNNRLYIPVVGPWLALSDRGSCDPVKTSCDHDTTAKILLVADGIFQAAGVLGVVDGLLAPSSHKIAIRNTTAKRKPTIHMIPTFTNGNPALAVLGKF